MHFYKSPWVTLIDTYLKPLQTFSFIVAYYHTFKNAWTNANALKKFFQIQHIIT